MLRNQYLAVLLKPGQSASAARRLLQLTVERLTTGLAACLASSGVRVVCLAVLSVWQPGVLLRNALHISKLSKSLSQASYYS